MQRPSVDSTVFIPSFLKTFDRIAGKASFHGLKPLPRMEIISQLLTNCLNSSSRAVRTGTGSNESGGLSGYQMTWSQPPKASCISPFAAMMKHFGSEAAEEKRPAVRARFRFRRSDSA